MARPRQIISSLAAVATAATVVAVAVAPGLAAAADHLDAPNLGSIHVGADDSLSVTKANGPLDIDDTYVFRAADPTRTVLALTVNPAINLGIGPSTFAAGARYTFNVDTTGDAKADLRYVVTFGDPDARGVQHYTVSLAMGDGDARTVASGFTGDAKGQPISHDGVMAFAGPRSDPFFFDLLGFLGSIKGQGTRRLDDGKQSDFFAHLNGLGIVLEVPDSQLGGSGASIGVWTTTSSWNGSTWVQADQMGRPAINTVFNASVADKEAFNVTPPSEQRTALGGRFRNNIIGVLEALGGYKATDAGAIADILLPDVLTYRVGSVAAGPLNGRGLADDVIDVELGLVTQGAVPT
ncbi:MAG TPA: DUF4331 family protein, partial [Candidatus Dormibacteraeota bacterium]|nr:DUF4331 family protein [Candidatus Dormibacteraeota bacterium]